jgi:membrane-bound lytic murein transglycosylase A
MKAFASRWGLCAALGLILLVAALAPGCGPKPVLAPDRGGLGWQLDPATQGLDSWAELAPAVRRSLEYARTRPADALAFDQPWLRLRWAGVVHTLETLLEVLPRLDQDPGLLDRRFRLVRPAADFLLTGYYEPFIEASLTPDPAYPYPIYGKPTDVERVRPYHDRRAIDQGRALAGRGLEIAWAKDLVDVYFLHVPGSGRLLLPDGRTVHVLYAGTNKQPYASLGRILVERGYAELEEMSMQKIREILAANPHKALDLMCLNPKYIFFRLAPDGPYGASGAVLTPMVSAASDRGYIPNGAVLAVGGRLPPTRDGRKRRIAGLTLAQDTGTMRQNHLDLFCGAGPEAAWLAGHMRGRARAWVLVARDLPAN